MLGFDFFPSESDSVHYCNINTVDLLSTTDTNLSNRSIQEYLCIVSYCSTVLLVQYKYCTVYSIKLIHVLVLLYSTEIVQVDVLLY